MTGGYIVKAMNSPSTFNPASTHSRFLRLNDGLHVRDSWKDWRDEAGGLNPGFVEQAHGLQPALDVHTAIVQMVDYDPDVPCLVVIFCMVDIMAFPISVWDNMDTDSGLSFISGLPSTATIPAKIKRICILSSVDNNSSLMDMESNHMLFKSSFTSRFKYGESLPA